MHTVPIHTGGVDTVAIPVADYWNIPSYSMQEEYVSCTVIIELQRPYATPEYTGIITGKKRGD
jgi:hypothetical protein